MEETSMTCFAKSGTHGSLSCVDLPCSERRVVITTPPEQNHFLSGLTKNIIVETGDKRNEAMSSPPAAGKNSTFGAQRGAALAKQIREKQTNFMHGYQIDQLHESEYGFGDVETSDSDDAVSHKPVSFKRNQVSRGDYHVPHDICTGKQMILRSQTRKLIENSAIGRQMLMSRVDDEGCRENDDDFETDSQHRHKTPPNLSPQVMRNLSISHSKDDLLFRCQNSPNMHPLDVSTSRVNDERYHESHDEYETDSCWSGKRTPRTGRFPETISESLKPYLLTQLQKPSRTDSNELICSHSTLQHDYHQLDPMLHSRGSLQQSRQRHTQLHNRNDDSEEGRRRMIHIQVSQMCMQKQLLSESALLNSMFTHKQELPRHEFQKTQYDDEGDSHDVLQDQVSQSRMHEHQFLNTAQVNSLNMHQRESSANTLQRNVSQPKPIEFEQRTQRYVQIQKPSSKTQTCVPDQTHITLSHRTENVINSNQNIDVTERERIKPRQRLLKTVEQDYTALAKPETVFQTVNHNDQLSQANFRSTANSLQQTVGRIQSNQSIGRKQKHIAKSTQVDEFRQKMHQHKIELASLKLSLDEMESSAHKPAKNVLQYDKSLQKLNPTEYGNTCNVEMRPKPKYTQSVLTQSNSQSSQPNRLIPSPAYRQTVEPNAVSQQKQLVDLEMRKQNLLQHLESMSKQSHPVQTETRDETCFDDFEINSVRPQGPYHSERVVFQGEVESEIDELNENRQENMNCQASSEIPESVRFKNTKLPSEPVPRYVQSSEDEKELISVDYHQDNSRRNGYKPSERDSHLHKHQDSSKTNNRQSRDSRRRRCDDEDNDPPYDGEDSEDPKRRRRGNRKPNRDDNEESDPSSDRDTRNKYKRSGRMRWMKPEKFDGKGSWETFILQFQNCSEYNNWNKTDKAAHLRWSMTGSAA